MSKRRTALDEGPGSLVTKMLDEATEEIARSEAAASGKKLDGRGQPGRSGQVGKDKTGRKKATFDITLDRQALVDEIASAEGVAKSDIIELAIQLCYEAWQAEKLDFYMMRRPARSLRAEWKVDVPDQIGLFEGMQK